MPLQDFGSQTELNQNLANTFGYTGDFGSGGWGTFQQTLSGDQQAKADAMVANLGSPQTTAPPPPPPDGGGAPPPQNFGDAPDLNSILARMYGYRGDFSQGGWGDYFNTMPQDQQQQATGFIDAYRDPNIDFGNDPDLNRILSQEFGYGAGGTGGDFGYGGWADFYNQMSASERARADGIIAKHGGLPEQSMDAYGSALDWTNKALGMTPEQLSDKNLDPYMDPYQKMVIDAQMQEMQRQHQIQGTYRDAQATKAGALGGDRQAVYNSEADRNFAEQQNRWLSQLLSANFGQAQEGAKFDIGGQRQDRVDTYQGAYQLGGLSELGFDMGQKLMQGTEAMGVTQRGIEQSILDGSLEQYLTTMGFPADMARMLASSLPGASNQTGSDASNDAQMIETLLKTFIEAYKSSQTTS